MTGWPKKMPALPGAGIFQIGEISKTRASGHRLRVHVDSRFRRQLGLMGGRVNELMTRGAPGIEPLEKGHGVSIRLRREDEFAFVPAIDLRTRGGDRFQRIDQFGLVRIVDSYEVLIHDVVVAVGFEPIRPCRQNPVPRNLHGLAEDHLC